MPRVRARRGDSGSGDSGLDALLSGWSSQDPGRHRRPFTRRGWLLAAGLLGIVLVLAARLVFFSDDPATSAPAPGNGAPVASDGPCPDLPPVTALPASGKDNQWANVGAVQAPIKLADDAKVGPVHGGEGKPPSCFAPGPAGALFAAANFLAALTDPNLVGPAIRQNTASSAGRDALIYTLDNTAAALNVSGATGYTFVGYTFQSQTEKQATVSLAIYTERGALGQVNITVVREGTDWHVVPPPSGNFGDVVHQILDLNGYTRWAPTDG
jgi:hypothetical protein